MSGVSAIPENYPRICPYLHMDGAAQAIEFYVSVFGATERGRLPMPGGRVGHAELAIGDSVVMLADESPEMNIHGPRSFGGTPVSIAIYVEDVDATFAKAVALGATIVRPVEDQFYGDRSGTFEDAFGHQRSVQSHIEDVPFGEMERRAAALFGDAPSGS